MDNNKMIELCAAFGYENIPSKNAYMISFLKGDTEETTRLNIYFTTMTVTLQSATIGIMKWHNVDMEKLEDIISQY